MDQATAKIQLMITKLSAFFYAVDCRAFQKLKFTQVCCLLWKAKWYIILDHLVFSKLLVIASRLH